MIQNLKKVLSRLREVNLKVNPKKCILFSQKVKYLGHVISSKGISTDNDKITAVNNWPIPQNKKHLRSFLGLCSSNKLDKILTYSGKRSLFKFLTTFRLDTFQSLSSDTKNKNKGQ